MGKAWNVFYGKAYCGSRRRLWCRFCRSFCPYDPSSAYLSFYQLFYLLPFDSFVVESVQRWFFDDFYSMFARFPTPPAIVSASRSSTPILVQVSDIQSALGGNLLARALTCQTLSLDLVSFLLFPSAICSRYTPRAVNLKITLLMWSITARLTICVWFRQSVIHAQLAVLFAVGLP